MIRAVRHFLWYLDHHSSGGRGASRPIKAAHRYRAGPLEPKRRESAVRRESRRKPDDRHGPTGS